LNTGRHGHPVTWRRTCHAAASAVLHHGAAHASSSSFQQLLIGIARRWQRNAMMDYL